MTTPFVSCAACQAQLPLALDERYPEAGGEFPCPSCQAPLVLPPRAEMVRRFTPAPATSITCPTCRSRLPMTLDQRYPAAGGRFPCPKCRSPIDLPSRAEMLARLANPSRDTLGYDPDPFAPQPVRPAPPTGTSTYRAPPPASLPAPPTASGSYRAPAPGAASPGATPPVLRRYRMAAYGGGHEELDRNELWSRIRKGEVTATTELCEAGSDTWQPITAFPELARLLQQQGRASSAGVPRPGGMVSSPQNIRVPAPLGKRFAAKVLDGLALVLLNRIATSIFLPLFLGQSVPIGLEQIVADRFLDRKEAARRMQELIQQMGPEVAVQLLVKAFVAFLLISLVVSGLYAVLFVWKAGGTPGKLLLGMRVQTEERTNPGPARAFFRWICDGLGAAICLIGYILVFFDDNRRALHDQVCGTMVVDVSS